MTPSPAVMSGRPLLRTWLLTLLGCMVLDGLVYLALPAGSSGAGLLRWLLLPGTALYVALNGSLLFGGGFGNLGDALIVVLGSALAWSLPATVALRALARRRARPLSGPL